MISAKEILLTIDLIHESDGGKKKNPSVLSEKLVSLFFETWLNLNIWWDSENPNKEFPIPTCNGYCDSENEIWISWINSNERLAIYICEDGDVFWTFSNHMGIFEGNDKLNLADLWFQKWFYEVCV